eukprot:COSAG02_NODE_6353_length_3629_cov_9.103683_4_plen_95_part_00
MAEAERREGATTSIAHVSIALGTTNRAKLESVETAARQMFSAHSVWPCAADRSVSAVHLAQPCRTLRGLYSCCRADFATDAVSQRRERSTNERR